MGIEYICLDSVLNLDIHIQFNDFFKNKTMKYKNSHIHQEFKPKIE